MPHLPDEVIQQLEQPIFGEEFSLAFKKYEIQESIGPGQIHSISL